jgi:hypothetical protein
MCPNQVSWDDEKLQLGNQLMAKNRGLKEGAEYGIKSGQKQREVRQFNNSNRAQ